jgi:hypothetical protein
MIFTYHGSFNNLKADLNKKMEKHNDEMNTDYRVFNISTDRLSFGIERLGHADGKFFNAEITFVDNVTVLNGSICNTNSSSEASVGDRIIEVIITLLIIAAYYAIVGGIVFGLLYLIGFANIILPIIIPTLVLTCLRIRARREEKRHEARFIKFMTDYLGCSYQL